MGLRAHFGSVIDKLGLWALRAGRGSLVLDRVGLLQDIVLMTLLMGSLNCTVFAVFLELLQGEVPQGGEV